MNNRYITCQKSKNIVIETNKLYYMDCLKGMKDIKDKSINMILCDLPYGVTARNKWDEIIPFESLWEQYERIIKDNGAMVFTAIQPFSAMLIMSNKRLFKYEWIWEKMQGTGHLNAKKQPLRNHEHVLIFFKKQSLYNPQMQGNNERIVRRSGNLSKCTDYNKFIEIKESKYNARYPITIQKFNRDSGLHPTQKPLKLFEYLIKTYTNEGDLVLDNCIGSGTTAIACINLNRKFIGFENNKEYFDIANERIKNNGVKK